MLREQASDVSDSSKQEDGAEVERRDGIAEEGPVDHEDEYVDDDRFTTVTVEAVDVSKDGLHRAHRDDGEESDATETEPPQRKASEASMGREADAGKKKRVWSKERPEGVKKRKKKKFRYESKTERKATRFKERLGNKVKAKARKS